MARRKFLPALRSGYAAKPHPAQSAAQMKVVLGDYYGALAAAGVWNSSRSRPWPVERAISEGYERIIYVFRSVEAIAGQASRLPFRLKEDEEEVDDHPLYAILNHQANPMETGRQFRKRLGAQILLSKRGAFVEVTKSRGGTPLRMDLLPPGRTRPMPGTDGVLIDHYETVRADGTRSEIPAEQVIWFREPHPLDPYSGVTPLEAAGMSAELDFFARMYNVQFLKNDARPGGVLAINGDMDPDEMDRLEDKFGRGPAEAGKLTVIAGDVSYVDSVTRPRDMQYLQMAGNAKVEILTAFGVPESVLGYAADRTYANAGQEHINFWQVTMPPHLDLQVSGFDQLSEPELEGFFDVSLVEALQAAEAAKRQEKRDEFAAGLIPVDEYRVATGLEPYNVPATRCLYINSGLTPVPTSAADAKALSAMMAPAQDAGTPPDQGAPGDGEGSEGDGGQDNVGAAEGGEAPPAGSGNGDTGQKALPPPPRPAPPPRRPASGQPPLRLISSCTVKAAAASPGGDEDESAPDEQAHARLENQLAAQLTALATRWTERTLARLTSPKTRKGTRHWTPDVQYKQDQRAGNQALDASQAVDGRRWQDEAQTAVAPVIEAAALAAATALAADLAGDAADPHIINAAVTSAARTAADAVVTMVGNAAAGLAAKVADIVNQADQDGQAMDEITTAVRQAMDHETAVWAPGVAAQAATATIAGARDGAAQAVDYNDHDAHRHIVRVWRSRRDARVRDTHQTADGQQQKIGTPFIVGDSLLRYPGDPLGPPGETYNCRCVLNHKSVRSGQYVPTPAGQVTRHRVAAAAT